VGRRRAIAVLVGTQLLFKIVDLLRFLTCLLATIAVVSGKSLVAFHLHVANFGPI
jgi:hypothetical protein